MSDLIQDSERALLCAMLQSAPAADLGGSIVSRAAFTNVLHANIWQAIRDQSRTGAIDVVLVSQRVAIDSPAAAQLLPDIATLGTPVVALRQHAATLNSASRQREVLKATQRIQQAAGELDADDFAAFAAAQMSLAGEALEGTSEETAVPGLMPFADFTSQPDDPQSWIVPNLIESGDVVMMLADEGAGKSVLSRMMCLSIAAGIHPFKAPARITPQRTLLVDLENAAGTIRRDGREQVNQVGRLSDGEFNTDNAWLWHYPRGLDLRQPKDAALLERVIAQVRPRFVAFGSLYKAYTQGSDSWEAAAQEVRVVLDRLRAKYGVAWLLEHHQPKGDGKDRARVPYGSSEWLKWCGYGRALVPVAEHVFELRKFRGDREAGRDWPAGLRRGGLLRWEALDEDELDWLRTQR